MSEPHNPNLPWWQQLPLYVQIMIALILAVGLGVALGAGNPNELSQTIAKDLAIPCSLVLKALRALATPLILLAVLHTFLTTNIPGRSGRRLAVLLITNTTAAILIGLLVANILQPGRWGQFTAPTGEASAVKQFDPWGIVQDSIPEAVLKPLVDNNVIQLIVLALGIWDRAAGPQGGADCAGTYRLCADRAGNRSAI